MSDPYTGEIRMFAGGFAPRGYALCDGQLLNISQYDALFSLLGTFYGGDGRTTFGLPDLRGRVPIHQGSGPGLTPRNMGQKGGLETVTLTENELAQHRHDLIAENDTADSNAPAGNVLANATTAIYLGSGATGMKSETLSNTGGGQDHNNIMPFKCINFIIALSGVYPSRS